MAKKNKTETLETLTFKTQLIRENIHVALMILNDAGTGVGIKATDSARKSLLANMKRLSDLEQKVFCER